MSRENGYGPYEDELDRMRARRRNPAPKRQRQRAEDFYDDEDFELEDLDNEDFFEDEDFFDNEEADEDYPDEEDYGYDSRQRGSKPYGGRQNQRTSGYQNQRSQNQRNQNQRNVSGYGSIPKNNHHTLGKKKRKRKAPAILLTLCLVLLLFSGVLYAKRWMKDRDGYWNIAVFGVDSRDGGLEKGALADVQMIASINKRTGEIRLVSVYRDTYVQINDDGDFHKINEAYFKGGHEQALKTLKRNLDIDVDDYATFNWKAVVDGINILGGIDLEITDREFAYINSFITETVNSTGVGSFQLEHPGLNHLDGVQAVAYSRLRLMDTDFNRTERQRKVVSLALEKAKQADFKTLSSLTGAVLSEISTSIGVEDVIPLARNVNRYYLGQSGGFPFAKTTADVGKLDCVIPMTLESNVVFLHQFLFDREGYQPSASVKKISGIISERTGIYEEGKSAGIDQNLGGITGNSGSGNSGGNPGGSASGQGGGSDAGEAQNPPAPAETEAADTGKEESTAQETANETQETEEETKKETKPQEEETTASKEESEPAVVEPLAPEETTLSQEQLDEGPGAVNPPKNPENGNVNPVKPTGTPEPEIGPGFEAPGNNGE